MTPKNQTPSETPKYETTFNYLLTHRVIPQLMFSDLKLFYEKILTSPDTMRQFMQKAVAHATALETGQLRYEPPYPIEDFKMGIYGKEGSDESSEDNIIVIAFARFWEACDCVAIAFPVSRVGYYTCEVAVDPVNSDVSYMLGGWEPSGSSFRHNNYGEMPMPLDPQVFIDRVIGIAYGKGEIDPENPESKAYPNDELLKERTAEIKEIIAERNASYPVAVDPTKVGSYNAHTCSGGGYFYDEVLEYRVWVHASEGDNYEAFPSYEKALKFSHETQGAEEPLVLVLQREHVNQREDGTYEHITGDRITEWRVEWLTEETKRNENAIREFLKQHNAAE